MDDFNCIDAYAQIILGSRTHLLLVVGDVSSITNEIRDGFPAKISDPTGVYNTYENKVEDSWDSCGMDPDGWICGKRYDGGNSCFSNLTSIRFFPQDWTPFNRTVQYCLSKPHEQHCKLKFSLHIAVIVLVINLIKVICLAYTVFFITDSPPMTIGDAISSFLSRLPAKR